MAEPFTAEDFKRVLFRVEDNIFNIEDGKDRRTAVAALFIAANVMQPGVIEAALPEQRRTHMEPPYDERGGLPMSDRERDAAAIRKALTDAS